MPSNVNTVFRLLRRYRALMDRYLHVVAKEQGFHHTDTSALSHLLDQHHRGHVLSAGELGELLSLSGPATTAAIDRLEKHGLVERRHSPQDGRRVEVHLTDSFETAPSKSIFADGRASVTSVLKKHTPEEIDIFARILDELCDELENNNVGRPRVTRPVTHR